MRYGPYKTPNMKFKNILGEEGALWNYADTKADKPCDECTIVGMNAGLEYDFQHSCLNHTLLTRD